MASSALFLVEVCPSCGDLGDGNRHRRVVGPFAGLPAEASATDHGHLKFRAAGSAELVRSTQGITGCGAQQCADSTVKLSSRQCCPPRADLPFTHDWHVGTSGRLCLIAEV